MRKEVPAQIQNILNETRSELLRIYPDRLKEMILFGSYARGDFTNESDIDLLLLLDQVNDICTERNKYQGIISRISLKYDTVISIIPIGLDDFSHKKTPLILNINKEGIKV
ncbi:MAG TPA: nucleotidyltransferase domain-containing protein [Bacillota bacterium]|nr:nucleotidyltransferase domain-containing protein [Bacillota bacterium]